MELTQRVARVIQELNEIQAELEAPAGLSASRLPEVTLGEFKAAVDRLRMYLWAYMEANASPAHNDREARIQSFRVERATEMLVAVRTQMGKAGLGDEAHARNLLSEIRALAELAGPFPGKRLI